MTSVQPFHPFCALTWLFTYHALLIALKAVMKGATWIQAVTGDLCYVLNALAFNSVQQLHTSTLHPHSIAWQSGREALKSTVGFIAISSTLRDNKKLIEFWLLSPALKLPLCSTNVGISLLEEHQLGIEVTGFGG